jgi:hypothetical protein
MSKGSNVDRVVIAPCRKKTWRTWRYCYHSEVQSRAKGRPGRIVH